MTPKRNVWVSPALFSELKLAGMDVFLWPEGSISEEIAERLRLWPDTGWSLAERIILAETVWMDSPMPEHGGGLGSLHSRLEYWLSQTDDRFSLHRGIDALAAVNALGTIEVHVDHEGSFEPYTLRLPDERRQRNPSVMLLGVPVAGASLGINSEKMP